jgi:heptosyltransferase-2
LGDVLRSTAILHGIKKRYPAAKVVWYTKRVAMPFFKENDAVDEVLALEDPASIWRLSAQEFDLILSLDSSSSSAAIAKSLKSKRILGFTTNALGNTIPGSESAQIWFEMGLNDQLKKTNTENYFEHLYRIAELEWQPEFKPIYNLSPLESATVPALSLALGLDSEKATIGLNPGAGGRWRYKRWNEAHFVSLIKLLNDTRRFNILLVGGAEDREIIERIKNGADLAGASVIAPPEGDLRHFGMVVQLLDLLVCGDTLALHYGTALSKKIVALFGPTSAAEIELFGPGEKIFADIPCRCCYLSDCQVRPTCMDLISPNEVLKSILTLLPHPTKNNSAQAVELHVS